MEVAVFGVGVKDVSSIPVGAVFAEFVCDGGCGRRSAWSVLDGRFFVYYPLVGQSGFNKLGDLVECCGDEAECVREYITHAEQGAVRNLVNLGAV